MSKEDSLLSSYANILSTQFTTSTKLKTLNSYIKAKEQKYSNISTNAKTTYAISSTLSTILASATSAGIVINPELVNDPTAIALGALSVAGLSAGIIAYIIHKKYGKKANNYKFLRECTEAGIQSNYTLDKAKIFLKDANHKNPNTLQTLIDIIDSGHTSSSTEDIIL